MANIADLVVSLRADIADFRTGMDQANKSLNDVKSQFASAQEAASSFIEKIGEFIAAKEIVSFLEESAEATRSWAEQLSTFQGIAGVSSSAAATLAASAQLAGVQTDVVTQAMARLGTTIATHPQKFQQLGISIHDASGQLLPMTDIMRNTIAGLDEFKAGTDRAAAAGYLFGRGAEAWIAQLDKLGPELKAGNWAENSQLVHALGLDMADAKAQAAAWAKAQGTLKLELLGVQNQVGQALLPVIQELGAEILKLAQDGSFVRWGAEVGAAAKAMAEEIEIAAKAIDLVASAVDTSIKSDVELYNEITGFSTKSSVIAKPWTPSPNGGFVPPDMRGAMTGANAPGAGAGDQNAPDGTKTFNVPDPKQTQLNDSIAVLTANLQRETQQNEALAVAMGQGGDAAKKLQDQFTALNKIDAIRAQALRDGITLSDSQVASLTKLALAEGQSADVLQRATQLHNNLTDAMKKQDEEIQKLVQSSDGLTPKQDEIADKEGLLTAAFNQGTISAQQFDAALKQLQTELNGPDKGTEDFTKGLSTDLDTLLGKMTDFSGMIKEKQKTKGKDSIFAQLTTDANAFIKSLSDMLLKLLIINPLLNELGLGGQGDGKQLPTLFGNSNGLGVGPGTANTNSPFSTVTSEIAGVGKSVLGFLSGLFGGTTATGAAADADTATGASLNSDIVDALTGSGLGSGLGVADPFDTGLEALAGFAEGGDFTVAGSGSTDTQRVSFLATPGERISVIPEVASRGRSSSSGSSERGGGDININMPISGVHSDTFRANKHQYTGDMLRAISAGRRYA